MSVRRAQLLILASLVLAIVSSVPATVTASPLGMRPHVAAATPRDAVQRVIQPFVDRSSPSAGCNALSGKLAACPITPRLRAAVSRELRWEIKHTHGGNGNEFCRCQNPPRRVTISAVKAPYVNASGRFVEVETVWSWGSRPMNLTWITRQVQGRWQVDNNFCSGYPNKDLYHIPVGPCPST